jgi:hypothetical protein
MTRPGLALVLLLVAGCRVPGVARETAPPQPPVYDFEQPAPVPMRRDCRCTIGRDEDCPAGQVCTVTGCTPFGPEPPPK